MHSRLQMSNVSHVQVNMSDASFKVYLESELHAQGQPPPNLVHASPLCVLHSKLAYLSRAKAPEASLVQTTIERLMAYQKARFARTQVCALERGERAGRCETPPLSEPSCSTSSRHDIWASSVLPSCAGFQRRLVGRTPLPAPRQDAEDSRRARAKSVRWYYRKPVCALQSRSGREAGHFKRLARGDEFR
eukprot:3737029-Pleurochrysis_carterae.AAC.1